MCFICLLSMSKGREVFITSTVIGQNRDEKGEIVWYEVDWLIPHETIRREILRCEHGLARTNVVATPWKARVLNIWMNDFFLPAIHAHHNVEETIVGPFYQKLGAPAAEWGEGDHTHVVSKCR